MPIGLRRQRPTCHCRRRIEGQVLCADLRSNWPIARAANLMANEMWRTLILLDLLLIVACQHKRPDFTSRVREDCAAGDQWACDLLDSLAQARTASDPISSDGTQKP
jgi:hypothetical protein